MTRRKQLLLVAVVLLVQWALWEHGGRKVARSAYLTLWEWAPKPDGVDPPDRFLEPAEREIKRIPKVELREI